MGTNTCYMCDALATTKEHIPPKALFPKQKDLLGEFSLRKELITVPSCQEHNNNKSRDDEYLVFCLSTCFHGNDIKEQLFNTKIMRAIERRPDTYSNVLDNYQRVMLKHPDGKVEHTAAYSIDLKRFDSVLSHIARGLYYHHTQTKWEGPALVMSNELRDLSSKNSEEINTLADDTIERVSAFLFDTEGYGQNPEVFSYKIHNSRPKGFVTLMKFYSAITVAVTLAENSKIT